MVHQARESLAAVSGDICKDAGLTGRQLADLAGWQSSNVSKLACGRQAHTVVGNADVMLSQLDRVLTVARMSRVSFGIIPLESPYRVPTNQFCMFDDRLVTVETVSAELCVTQPREVALYAKAFDGLTNVAKYGKTAKAMLQAAIEVFR